MFVVFYESLQSVTASPPSPRSTAVLYGHHHVGLAPDERDAVEDVVLDGER